MKRKRKRERQKKCIILEVLRANDKEEITCLWLPFAMDSIHRCSNLICSVCAWRVCPLADSMRADLFRNLKLNHAQDHHHINYLHERLTLSILYLNRFINVHVLLWM